ncbi:MAG: nuclear transport factor 2 family protein [Pseudonocardia sp.]|nr:nuclear transport factor 2 family protein [Pseudonocardia sp.]
MNERAATDDVVANCQLVQREREGRDLCWWEAARDCFHPDSIVNVGWFEGSGAEFVAGSARMAEAGGATAHRLAPPIVHLGDDRAVVLLAAVITSRAVVSGQELDLEADCRIVYRTERRDGHWRIAAMDCIYCRDTLTPAVPGEPFRVPADELASLRPSYRMLAWSFARRGIPVRSDLLGEDQPARVAAFLDSAFAWAGIDPAR